MDRQNILKRVALALTPCLFFGAYTVDNPPNNSDTPHDLAIACTGQTNMGQAVVVKLFVDCVQKGNQAVTVAPMAVSWGHNFPAPSGGWDYVVGAEVQVWAGDPSTMQDANNFEVVE